MNRRCILPMSLIVLISLMCHAQAPKEDPLSKAAGLLTASKPLPATDLQVDALSAPSPFADSAWVWHSAYEETSRDGKRYFELLHVFFKDGRYVEMSGIHPGEIREDAVFARDLKARGHWKTGKDGVVEVSEIDVSRFEGGFKRLDFNWFFKIRDGGIVPHPDVDSRNKPKPRLNSKLTIEAMKNANDAKWEE